MLGGSVKAELTFSDTDDTPDGDGCFFRLGSTETYEVRMRTIVAIFDRSSKWAASTAVNIAPSKADRSHSSSVARNFLARLKNTAGFLDALTA